MKKVVTITLIALVAGALFSGVAFAKSHKVEFRMKAVINGVELEPGTYKLEINGENKVDIYKGKELVVSAEAKIVPLGNVYPNSVSQAADGKVKEIRLKKERVVFAES